MSYKLGTDLAKVGTDCISRQAAIEAVKNCYYCGEDSCGEPWIYEDHAIKAIKQLPPANCSEFPNNSDTISRQEAIEACMKYNGQGYIWSLIMKEIEQLPSAQPDIIRCKDCKHYRHGLCMKASMCVNKSENGFCDWAERREVTT